MMPLSSRERLLTVLRGELPDRVPVAPFVQEEYLHFYYPHKQRVDRVIDATALAGELDFDLMAKDRRFERPHFLKRSFPNWELEEKVRSADGIRTVRTEIRLPSRTLVHEESKPEQGAATEGVHETTTKYLLEDEDDIAAFIEYFPPIDTDSITEMRTTVNEWRKVLGERGVLAPWGWCGVFNQAAALRNIEDLMMDAVEESGLYQALMDKVATESAAYNRSFGETGIDCIGIQGHMANSRTVGADFFRKHVFPYEKRVIDAIQETGTFTVYHNCGFASTLYDLYLDLGITLWETISEPPAGDNRLAEVKERIGHAIVLLGNLDQIHFLKRAGPPEVAEAAARITRTGKPGGRYIFSTSDFLERGTPLENIKAMLEGAREAGAY